VQHTLSWVELGQPDERVAGGDDGERAVAHPQHRAADRGAFRLVGVQQSRAGAVVADQGEFPAAAGQDRISRLCVCGW